MEILALVIIDHGKICVESKNFYSIFKQLYRVKKKKINIRLKFNVGQNGNDKNHDNLYHGRIHFSNFKLNNFFYSFKTL